jgi:malonyl-CoA/methylmalonyl-CoA synthetase
MLHTPIKNANLFTALRAGFPADLGKCAIQTDAGLEYSWSDLEQGTAMVANFLLSLDLPAGSRVAAHVDKSVEALILYLATLRAGLVYLPLNIAYQSLELAYFIKDAEPAVLVCSERNFGWISKLAFLANTEYVFTLNDDRTGTLLDRAAQFPREHMVAIRNVDDVAAIIYTSGTTGRSKGAMLSHGNLLSNARVLHHYWDWRQEDVLLHALPIFHVHGLFVAIHGALLSGSKMIWCAQFSGQSVLRLLSQATVFMGVPTLYVRLLSEPALSAQTVRGMRLFISGSAPLLPSTFAQWQHRTGHTILERYGMSETAMLTSNPCRPEDGKRIAGTVGRPLDGVKLRLCDAAGQSVFPGAVGSIQVKGLNIFSGYWRMPEKTAEEFTEDGFFKTGDVGSLNEQGYLTIVGRSKDLIISGGYNVYPAEVEYVINSLAGVAESAVVGIPDADFGEVSVAVVVAKPDAVLDGASILSQLKTLLANYKIPKRCDVIAELPRNAMGKVQKNTLRTQYKCD